MHAVADDTPTACENCGTMLQGAYCHACGQSAHNPLRHVAHALEEVFESFWHLDGRVFRTLRDLVVPGRVAANYLRGQRARYIPPLRLFIVLSVLTFFVGHFTVGDTEDPSRAAPVKVQLGGADTDGSARFRDAKTDAEVQAVLDRELANLARARKETGNVPLMSTALDRAERELRAAADARRAALHGGTRVAGTQSAASAPAKPQGAVVVDNESGAQMADRVVRMIDSAKLRDPKKPWDERTNPADFASLPAFADRWLNHRLGNTARNVDRMKQGDGQALFFELMLAAVPSALFMLVPVFALLLRVFYLRSGRSWLEHLVVALYSHAYLLLTLFVTFVLALLPIGAGTASGISGLLWLWAAVYLLLMQRRVYAQHWAITIVKYLVIGFTYQFLVMAAIFYIAFAGLSSGA